MKKFFAVILVLFMCAGPVGCGVGGTSSSDNSSSNATASVSEVTSNREEEELKKVVIGSLTVEIPKDWEELESDNSLTFAPPKINGGSPSVLIISKTTGLGDIGGLKTAKDIFIGGLSSTWESYSAGETIETELSGYYAIKHKCTMLMEEIPCQGDLVAVDDGQNLYNLLFISSDEEVSDGLRKQFEDSLKTVNLSTSQKSESAADSAPTEESQSDAIDKTSIQDAVNKLIPESYKGKAYACDVLTKTDGSGYILSIQLDIGTDEVNAVDEGFIKMWKDSFATLNGVEEVQISLVSNSQLVDLEEDVSSKVDIESVLSKEKLSAFRNHIGRMEFEEFCKKLKKEDATNKSIQEMLELSSEAEKLKEKLTVEKDDIEGDTLYYYGNIKQLTEDIHLSTVIDNGQLKCKVGVYNSDWLFFDKVVIKPNKSDKIEKSYESYDVETDVVDGGIREWTSITFYEDDIDDLIEAESAVIRFINREKDEHLDFDITAEELSAFKCIGRIEEIQDEIEDILYNRESD